MLVLSRVPGTLCVYLVVRVNDQSVYSELEDAGLSDVQDSFYSRNALPRLYEVEVPIYKF